MFRRRVRYRSICRVVIESSGWSPNSSASFLSIPDTNKNNTLYRSKHPNELLAFCQATAVFSSAKPIFGIILTNSTGSNLLTIQSGSVQISLLHQRHRRYARDQIASELGISNTTISHLRFIRQHRAISADRGPARQRRRNGSSSSARRRVGRRRVRTPGNSPCPPDRAPSSPSSAPEHPVRHLVVERCRRR